MQIKIFTVPLSNADALEAEANAFLRSHRVLQVERHFCPDCGGYWTLFVEYMDGDPTDKVPPAHRRDKQDPTLGLDEEQKQRFEKYRQVRQLLARKNSIPAYLIFTNEELASLARLPVIDRESIRGVKDIAPSRLKAYIEHFYTESNAEEGGEPDAEDSIAAESA